VLPDEQPGRSAACAEPAAGSDRGGIRERPTRGQWRRTRQRTVGRSRCLVAESPKPPEIFRFADGKWRRAEGIVAKWIANSPLAMVDQYVPNLNQYHSIMMDGGLEDGLAASNKGWIDRWRGWELCTPSKPTRATTPTE
jgi:hypothetical protein